MFNLGPDRLIMRIGNIDASDTRALAQVFQFGRAPSTSRLGAWPSSVAALNLLQALRVALKASPAWCSERVEDVLVETVAWKGGNSPLLRCVECAAAGDAAPLSASELADWAMSSWRADSQSVLASCDAALLTHTFSWPAGGSAGATLELRVLITTSAADTPQLQKSIFGPDELVLQTATGSESRCACVVKLRSGTDNILGEQELLMLPAPLRRALKQHRSTQVLSSLAACLRRGWLGGLLLLSDVAAPLLEGTAAAAPLKALTSQLRYDSVIGCDAADMASAGSNGVWSQPSTERSMARIRAAEALEARADYAGAAALYKSCVDDDASVLGGLTCSPPLTWQYYGLALKRAGNTAGAIRAYESGLKLLASGCRITPAECRETNRLQLYSCLLNIARGADRLGTWVEMFAPAVPGLRSWGQLAMAHDQTGHWIEQVSSGIRYAVVMDKLHSSVCGAMAKWRIARLPDRIGPYSNNRTVHPNPMEHTLVLISALSSGAYGEQDTAGARSMTGPGQVALPELQRAACAACGVQREGLKFCGKCFKVKYCDAECQVPHWPQHKRACRAAVAAAAEAALNK